MDRLNRIAGGYTDAKVLLAAAQLRVFDHLRAGACAAEVAEAIGGGRRGVEILLDALVALEIVDKDGDVYTNRREVEPSMVSDGPTHFASLLRHRNRCLRKWAFLEETILGREPDLSFLQRRVREEPADNDDFIRAMFAVSHERVGSVADHLDLAGVRALADIGGGPGHYLAELARRCPDAAPYLCDLPPTLDVAARLLAGTPEGERIRLVPWDVYEEPPPAELPPLDLAFVSMLVHSEPPEANEAFLGRLFGRMAPGGRVVIHESVVEEGRTAPKAAALFSVNMLAMTQGGRSYTAAEIGAWGRAAGFDVEPGERLAERSYLVRLRRS